MSVPFTRTMRSLAAEDGAWVAVRILGAALLLVAWLGWFFLADVQVYETSLSARIEVDEAAFDVDTLEAGRVRAWNLALGRRVEAGEVLVELDDRDVQLEIEERRGRATNLQAQVGALDAEIESKRREKNDARRAATARVREAQLRLVHAEQAQRIAFDEQVRARRMHEQGVGSQVELSRRTAEAVDAKANRAGIEAQIERMRAELVVAEAQLDVALAALARQRVALVGQHSAEMIVVQRLEHRLAQLEVRAPASGVLSEVRALQPGAVVEAGERLASIVPAGEVKMIARLAPAAIGRVRVGQRGRVRLDSFPWTQYGMVPARVVSVGGEAGGARMQIELRLEPAPRSAIELQHGQTGVVEVEVETVAPSALVVRAAGGMLRGARPPP